MKPALLVVESFLDYAKGDMITDAKKIKQLQDSEWQGHVVKTQVKDVPADPVPK